MNLAFGSEYRTETYGIFNGETNSWQTFDQTQAGGAQGVNHSFLPTLFLPLQGELM